jgi:hypothetical protein
MIRRSILAVAALSAASFALTPIAAQQHAPHSLVSQQPVGPGIIYTLVPVHGTWSADYQNAPPSPKSNLIQVLTLEGMTTKPVAPDPEPILALWGTDGAAFLKNATAKGAFPLAIARDLKEFRAGALSVEFKLVAGQTDQSAGIAFNIKPDGSYYFARYNTKDGNVAVWKFENGTRTVLTHGAEHEQLKLGEWHHLEVRFTGTQVEATANKKLTVKHTLDAAPSGRVGVWAKNDSVTSFRNFRGSFHH